jgi:hypothetical protein
MLRAEGIEAPAVFGDPALLLPRLWPGTDVERRHELGVFVHVSELDAPRLNAAPLKEFRRYEVPAGLGGVVVVHHTLVSRSVAAMRAALDRLLRCRRVLSTGLHALVLAEAYGIPCAVFDIHAGPHAMVAPDDDGQTLDHRMRDFYAGLGAPRVPVFRTNRHLPTDWDAAIRFIDTHWSPTAYDPAPLLSAFPESLRDACRHAGGRGLGRADRLVARTGRPTARGKGTGRVLPNRLRPIAASYLAQGDDRLERRPLARDRFAVPRNGHTPIRGHDV